MTVLMKVREYLASVRAEVTRVSWPSRREVVTFTVLVILLTLALGLYLGLADRVLQYFLRLLLTK
jgi:preprotein translocase subunit SecE